MRILQLSDIHYRTHYTNDNAYERLLAKLESPLKHLELCLQDALQHGKYDCLCLTGDICDNELFLKRTPTADKNFLQTQNCVVPMKVQRH